MLDPQTVPEGGAMKNVTGTPGERFSRVILDGLVIVTSILLAFGLDAWWASQQRDMQRDELMSALLAEFDASVQEFERVSDRNGEVIVAADSLLLLYDSGADLFVAPGLLANIVLVATMDPPTGTLNAMLSSGDIRLIENQELKALLAAWPAILADVIEEEQTTAKFVEEELIPHLATVTELGPVFASRRARFTRNYLDQDEALTVEYEPIVLEKSRELRNLIEIRHHRSLSLQLGRPLALETLDHLRETLASFLDHKED